MKTLKKRMSNGRYVYLTKIDDDHGSIEFPGCPGRQAVKDLGTYGYDKGGKMYREACDLYRKVFG